MRQEYKVVRRENNTFPNMLYLCSRKFGKKVETFSFILAVALSTVVSLLIIGLVLGVVYYRWRTKDLMAGITEFIGRNWKLEQEIQQLIKTNHSKK